MTELVNINKGEGEFNLKIEDGQVKMTLGYDGDQADAGLYVNLSIDKYLDMLAEAIPGEIDDAVIELLKSAMK
jgi:hypothetical protein